MNKIRTSYLIAFLAVVAMVGLVVRQLSAGPSYSPRTDDMQRASREVAPPLGAKDDRQPLPAGDLVGGAGIIEPAQREARVAGNSAGVVNVVKVKEGDHVGAGDVLIELESSVEEASVKSAEADLTSAKASLSRALNGQRVEDRDAAAAEAQAATSRAELSATALSRA
jgi:multidrug efflux pump subunit AcrA (membrane-fusion protein)